MSPRGDGGKEGRPVGPGLRGGRQLAAKTTHVGLVVSRVPGVTRGEARIRIKAYKDDGVSGGLGIHGELFAEVGPGDIRQTLIQLSPELYAFIRKALNG